MESKTQKKNFLKFEIMFGKVKLTEKAIFAKHLAMMLKSGLTIQDALVITEDSASGKMKKIIGKILNAVQGGTTLAGALSQHPKTFSQLFINVTNAGEKSGTLSENLEHIALQLEKEKALSTKIKSAMAYPVVIMAAAFVMALGMAYFVLPKITPLFIGLDIELPITTRMVLWFSAFVQNYGGITLIVIIIAIPLLSWLLRKKFIHPITHFIFLHTPLLKSIVKQSNLARFSRTLGTLLKSGLNIDEALQISQSTVSNYYYRRALGKVAVRVKRGTSLGANLAEFPKLFPKLVTSMVRVGEESGKLDETLLYVARFYELEVDSTTKMLTTAIEPMLLIVIGLVVGVLALAIVSPIYQVTGNVKRG